MKYTLMMHLPIEIHAISLLIIPKGLNEFAKYAIKQ
jgi:hypothetical protein